MRSRRFPPKGWKRWFRVNCSMMLYEWDGKDWVFTGTATRIFLKDLLKRKPYER